MRIKDEIFCFAHLRWCHNGWVSNISIVVDTGYAGIHHSKYWMPIHYDTIEDGQNKKSHLLFSNHFTRLKMWLHITNKVLLPVHLHCARWFLNIVNCDWLQHVHSIHRVVYDVHLLDSDNLKKKKHK